MKIPAPHSAALHRPTPLRSRPHAPPSAPQRWERSALCRRRCVVVKAGKDLRHPGVPGTAVPAARVAPAAVAREPGGCLGCAPVRTAARCTGLTPCRSSWVSKKRGKPALELAWRQRPLHGSNRGIVGVGVDHRGHSVHQLWQQSTAGSACISPTEFQNLGFWHL